MYKVVPTRACCVHFMSRETDLSNPELIETIKDANSWLVVRNLLIMSDFWIEYMGILSLIKSRLIF